MPSVETLVYSVFKDLHNAGFQQTNRKHSESANLHQRAILNFVNVIFQYLLDCQMW